MYKQLIIARKDLNMSPGKLALLFFWKRFFGEAKKWFGKEMAYGYKSRYRLIP